MQLPRIAEGDTGLLVFLWHPLEPQPHDPDVKALLRVVVVCKIPAACNRATADFLISSPLMNRVHEPWDPSHDNGARRSAADGRLGGLSEPRYSGGPRCRMRPVAKLLVDDDAVTVSLSAAEKLATLHGDVRVPRAAVRRVRAVPDGMKEVHGLRMPGTGIPGVIMAGRFRAADCVTFAVCYGHRPAVVIDLAGQPYDRLVVTVDNADDVVRSVTEAAGPGSG